MRVYVESNFPLELARQQEEVAQAEELLLLAESGRIELIYPAIALTEPFSTLLRYSNERSKALETLNHQLNDLGRSQPHKPLVASSAALVAALTTSIKDETDLLEHAVDRMLRCGRSITLTSSVFSSARAAEVQYGLTPQDAIVFASIIEDLGSPGAASSPSCFLSKNSKDFWATRGEFASRQCRYMSKFSDGLKFARAGT
jgi:predicted nucleic acid-binding protein